MKCQDSHISIEQDNIILEMKLRRQLSTVLNERLINNNLIIQELDYKLKKLL